MNCDMKIIKQSGAFEAADIQASLAAMIEPSRIIPRLACLESRIQKTEAMQAAEQRVKKPKLR